MSDFAVERGQDTLGLLGTVVAKHRLLRVIGDGGMGTVYVGEHEILKELRAIKVCKVLGIRGLKERAVNEARMMAKLNHPGICKLYDVELGPPDGTSPVMVMELLNGQSFFEEISAGAIGWQRAVEVAIDVLDALEEAHRLGIIHRDIKPENVFIARRPDGRLITKVMDFGIAKLIAVSATQTGMQMGTPHYMSPEQTANSKAVDARADIYSVAAMLYRSVTGSYLFPRETAVQIFAGHLNDEPRPVRSLVPALPELLAQIIHRALAKDKEQRFANAAEMRDALRRCLTSGGQSLRADPQARTFVPVEQTPVVAEQAATLQREEAGATDRPRRVVWALAAVALVAAAVALVWALRQRAPIEPIQAGVQRQAMVPVNPSVTALVTPSVVPSVEKPPTDEAAPAARTVKTTRKKKAPAKQQAPLTNGVITGVFDD